MITEDDLQRAVLDELAAAYQLEERLPGDVDRYQVAEAMGVSPTRAARRMDSQVAQGRYTKHIVRNAMGQPHNVWRKVS
jgi:predicted ArsR family transcriptional regulator